MSKVTVVGAGNVGATVANVLAHQDYLDEIDWLILKAIWQKAKLWILTGQQAPIDVYSTHLSGTEDYEKTAGSDIVVITAGLPRKPGMSRDDLISTNANIVNTVTKNILQYSPNAILIIVSNPLDVMTYAAHKTSGLPAGKVIGMAGILDTARYRAFLADALGVSPKEIKLF